MVATHRRCLPLAISEGQQHTVRVLHAETTDIFSFPWSVFLMPQPIKYSQDNVLSINSNGRKRTYFLSWHKLTVRQEMVPT